MNIRDINTALSNGDVTRSGVLPKVDVLADQPAVFSLDFGLDELPEQPGLLLIRGARQYGKSTWLQQQIKKTIEDFGPGSAFYLNGDEIRNDRVLEGDLLELAALFSKHAKVRRIFVDEITAVKNWEKALKRMLDRHEPADVLLVTTGSRSTDLRRGSERLPGRKGRLDRTHYLFTPMSFGEFFRVCNTRLPERELLPAYMMTGGSPPAVLSLLEHGFIAPYVIEIVRDWIYGELAAAGRSRELLLGVLECIYRYGGTPVGYSKLAREAGMANNTVAAGYLEQLADLMCVAPAFSWDDSKNRLNRRRPCKFHMINMLAATAWHPARIRCPADFYALLPEHQAILMEWMVAQECWRRAAVKGIEIPEKLVFWNAGAHELDYVLDDNNFIEVKRGRSGPLDFGWFGKTFPKGRLTVICANAFETDRIRGIGLSDFLMSGDGDG